MKRQVPTNVLSVITKIVPLEWKHHPLMTSTTEIAIDVLLFCVHIHISKQMRSRQQNNIITRKILKFYYYVPLNILSFKNKVVYNNNNNVYSANSRLADRYAVQHM